jgi:hypothetical protein
MVSDAGVPGIWLGSAAAFDSRGAASGGGDEHPTTMSATMQAFVARLANVVKRGMPQRRLMGQGETGGFRVEDACGIRLTPKFSCKHATTIAAKPHPKSACQLQRSLDSDAR